MELTTNTMKFLLITILSIIIGVFLVWFFSKAKQRTIIQKSFSFTIPIERVHKEVLANGMNVLIFKDVTQPKVLVQIAYEVGSYVEDSGERGLAHLVEHMIYKGTSTLSESDIDGISRKYGASFNAFTSLDVTSYYFEINKNNWKPFLPILADCMQNARFDEQHLASEVKAVVQELKMGRDNFWGNMVWKACELVFPPNHPYHVPIIGFKEDLLNLSSENLKKFYKKYYRPDRATLFVVGDVEAAEIMPIIKQNFESIKADQDSVIKKFPTIVSDLVTHHTRYFEDVKKEQLGFYWIIPGLKSPIEHLPSVVEDLLGAGQSGRLVRLLVDERKVATSVGVKASKFMEAGVFLIFIEPMPQKSEECEQLVKLELEKIMREGVKQEELERVAKQKAKKFFHKMQNYTELAYNWIKSYYSTRDELDIFKRVNKYFTVTPAQVQEFTQGYLDPFLMNRIEVLPLPVAKKSLREAIKQQSDALDKKILAQHQRVTAVEPQKVAQTLPAAESLTFSFPKPNKVIDLPNGMRILLAVNKQVPLIACDCYLRGAYYLDDARDGISVGFMMEMLMEGSKGFSKEENVDFFEQRGANYTFSERAACFSCLSGDFDELAERFDYILRHPTFPKESIDKLKEIFTDTYQRSKDSPRAMAIRLLRNNIYKNHPFAWTYDDAISIVDGLKSSMLERLHKEYVNAKNVVVSISGDFELAAMTKIVQKIFGQWPQGAKKEFANAPRDFQPNVTIDHAMMRDQMFFVLGRPSPVTLYDPDLIPLKMLNIICFKSLGSRIFKVREQTGLFYTAFGAFASNATKEPGYDFVGMIVNPENVEFAEKQVRTMLDVLVKEGVVQYEIDAAKQIYLKDLIDLVADNNAIARLLAMVDVLDLGFDYYDKVLARVQAMNVSELNSIAVKYGAVDGMIRICVGPALKKNVDGGLHPA